MRASLFIVGLLACMITLVAAWSKEDQEIFRLKDEVELSEGPGVTFYDFLDIKPSASQEEINKAYRKKSKVLHPDKVKRQFVADKSTGKDKKDTKGNKGKKGANVNKAPSNSEVKSAAKAASDRFARLGIVTEILRGSGRERYDHFLSNGFPKWKGTGYYYARFRPGFFTVLSGLFVFVGGGGHWLALYMSWKRDQEYMRRLITHARKETMTTLPGLENIGAGSGTATPAPAAEESEALQQLPRNRKERRMADKREAQDEKDKKGKKAKPAKVAKPVTPPSGPSVPKKKVMAPNGRILSVDSAGNVYMEQRGEENEIHEFLLDPAEHPCPTWKSTSLYRLPAWFINKVYDRLNPSHSSAESDVNDESEDEMEEEGASESTGDDFEVIKKDKAKTSAINGTGKANKRGGKKGRK